MDLAILRGLSADTNLNYLYYRLMLHDARRYMLARAGGTTVLHLEVRAVPKFRYLAAPYSQQQRIAEILSTVDEAIEHTEALIAKTQQIKAGLMHDLFTRGVTPAGKLRPPREEAPQLYQESPLGWIPKEWQARRMGDVCHRITDGDHHTPRRAEAGVYLLSARNVLDGELALGDVDYVPEAEYERMIQRCHPEPGDVLLSCSGTIGRVCEVPVGFRCALVRSAALLKLNPSTVSARYVEWMLQSEDIRRQIRASQRQAAQPNLFQAEIGALSFGLPSPAEQAQLARRLDGVKHYLECERETLRKLMLAKRGLMQDLLTGRVCSGSSTDTAGAEVAANV